MGPEVYDKLQSADWDRLSARLAHYCLHKVRRLYWRRGNSAQLAKGETVESLVSLAVERVYSGERNWDPNQDPDLEEYLKTTIDSLVNHLATSLDNRTIEALPTDPPELDRVVAAASLSPRLPNPEVALLAERERRREEQIVEAVMDLIADDPGLVKVWDCVWDGIFKPEAIAEATGLAVKDVYQLKRKLTRRLKDLPSDLGIPIPSDAKKPKM